MRLNIHRWPDLPWVSLLWRTRDCRSVPWTSEHSISLVQLMKQVASETQEGEEEKKSEETKRWESASKNTHTICLVDLFYHRLIDCFSCFFFVLCNRLLDTVSVTFDSRIMRNRQNVMNCTRVIYKEANKSKIKTGKELTSTGSQFFFLLLLSTDQELWVRTCDVRVKEEEKEETKKREEEEDILQSASIFVIHQCGWMDEARHFALRMRERRRDQAIENALHTAPLLQQPIWKEREREKEKKKREQITHSHESWTKEKKKGKGKNWTAKLSGI